MDDVSEEPVFQDIRVADESDSGGVWGEPALADAAAAGGAREVRREWLARQWAAADGGTRIGVFAALCAFSGLAAVVCVLLKAFAGFGVLAIAVAAPVAEEMSKAILPLMVLERRPWLFGSYATIVLVGAMSGLVFASVENLLYFFLYIPEGSLTMGTILWRLLACTALHVCCSTLVCSGLACAWRKARARLGEFEMSVAMPRLVAAVAIHGLYNFGVVLFSAVS